MQDRAAIKAAGDHGRAHNLGRMGDMRLVGHDSADDMAETDICAGWTGSLLSRSAAEAEAQSSGRGNGRRFTSRNMAGPLGTGAPPCSALDRIVRMAFRLDRASADNLRRTRLRHA
jgi:hypothetical protein